MARSCAICGKVSMGGFNPQSSGMNRVRAHRRYQPHLPPLAAELQLVYSRLAAQSVPKGPATPPVARRS